MRTTTRDRRKGNDMTTTPFTGGFTPVTEEITAFDLEVTGRIPAELTGRYLRNGPNPLGLDDPTAYHLLTGEGMVHGLRLRDGRAEWYRNRWVRSAAVARRLGEKPRSGPVHAGDGLPPNTHVIGLAGRTFATQEGGARPYELSYELDTIGPCDFGGALPGGTPATPTSTRSAASCTRSRTSGAGTITSTSSSTPRAW